MNSEAAHFSTDTSAENPTASAAPASIAPQPGLPSENPHALLKTLQARFPVFRDCLPLSIGIDKAIKAVLPEVSRKNLRIALALHTHGNRYLRGMTKATQRFDLEGAPAGEVTEEHRQHAIEILRGRMKKQAEERRAQQKAEREVQKMEREAQKVARKAQKTEQKAQEVEQDVEAERVHAEKLNLLAQKFSRH
jgi:ProP effector